MDNKTDNFLNELFRQVREEMKPVIRIMYHDDDPGNQLIPIEKTENGDWIDLRAAETVEMKAGEFKLISLGVSMKLPAGFEAHIVPRSSTFMKWGIIQSNSFGIIDNSFAGSNDVWHFPAIALRDTVIHKNDRICQFRLMRIMDPIKLSVVDRLDGPDRGGFGSTGEA